ncbi:MAG: DUF4468 domain-containing protein [Bacteroides sp.]|jgi:hypothetical protein|nr:DUF4468 domain-containing protein [Bacteroides sp.]
MKKLFFTMFVAFFTMIGSAQETQKVKTLSFAKVIEVENKSKNEIYSGLRIWVAENYKSAQAVIQMEDKDAGVILVKALFSYEYGKLRYSAYTGHVDYTLKLQAKDGRFRAEMSNFTHTNKVGNAPNCSLGLITTAEEYTDKGMHKTFHNNVWNDIKKKAEAESLLIFLSLKGITNFTDDSSEDW